MENKKKIVIPVIIGVIILVLIAIGVTYAFFGVNNTASGTTNLDATTQAIGNVIVTNPTENLYLKLSAYEMQESVKGTSYYATATNSDSKVVYASDKENNVLANYTISGGADDTPYTCTFKLNVTKPTDILEGDMNLELSLLNGATINGSSILDVDLYSAESQYTVLFKATGNVSGNLITGDIKLNNTTSTQNHLVGKTLGTNISLSDISCRLAKTDVCTLASDSSVAAGERGAKYECKVDPNKDAYTFYLLNNNADGTSDLIMNANVNASGEPEMPGTNESESIVQWNSSVNNVYGPVDAITYLYNATKNWTNIDPINYTYYDREFVGITDTNRGYVSFISTNGVATITGGDANNTQVVVGSESEPLRTRMPIYYGVWDENENYKMDEKGDLTYSESFLFENLEESIIYGYWTMSSVSLTRVGNEEYDNSNNISVYTATACGGGSCFPTVSDNSVDDLRFGIRPIINVTL